MTVHVRNAAIDGYVPSNGATDRASADYTIPSGDIRGARLSTRIQESKDSGQFTVTNDGGTYSDDVAIGHRWQFYTRLAGESSLSRRWTGIIRDVGFRLGGGDANRLSVQLDDFVFGVFADRHVTNAFENAEVSGTSADIVNTIVSNNAPEVTLGQVDGIAKKRTVEYQRKNLLDALSEMAERSTVVMSSDGVAFVWTERGSLTPDFDVVASDYQGRLRASHTDRKLVNDVIVDGAREDALDIEQTASDSTETVTDTNRRTQQVDVRKGEMAAVAFYITDSGSSDSLVYRVQADDGSGNPKEPANFNTDLARTKVPPEDFSGTGWVKAVLPENNLPDPNPHIMVEADGATGHDVHYDSGTAETRYQVFYWFPVTLRSTSDESITDHRRHEGRYGRETIRGRDEGENIAANIIRSRSEPRATARFAAKSTRAHNLTAADMVRISEPDANLSGEFVVRGVEERYNGVLLGTAVECRNAESI